VIGGALFSHSQSALGQQPTNHEQLLEKTVHAAKVGIIIHFPRKKVPCDEIIVDAIMYAAPTMGRNHANDFLPVVATKFLGENYNISVAPFFYDKSDSGTPWIELKRKTPNGIEGEAGELIAKGVAKRYQVKVVPKQDHTAWRTAKSASGINLDNLQPQLGHRWEECFSNPKSLPKPRPYDPI
jgi:hypothetical protein